VRELRKEFSELPEEVAGNEDFGLRDSDDDIRKCALVPIAVSKFFVVVVVVLRGRVIVCFLVVLAARGIDMLDSLCVDTRRRT